MDMNKIYDLWDRFEKSSAAEMEIDMEGVHFSLKKPVAQAVNVAPLNVTEQFSQSVLKEEQKTSKEVSSKKTITAPLVGTFYCAPSPDSKPFVEVGSEVKKGDVIGIIEAMKLMNEVQAPEDGTVDEILAEDGTMVEYGQVIMSMK